MFHQLINLVTNGISASSEYSIGLHSDESMQYLVAHFWVDTALQHACIAAVPRSLSFPATLFEHLSGLMSLLTQRTPIVSVIGANSQVCTALNDYLNLPSVPLCQSLHLVRMSSLDVFSLPASKFSADSISSLCWNTFLPNCRVRDVRTGLPNSLLS